MGDPDEEKRYAWERQRRAERRKRTVDPLGFLGGPTDDEGKLTTSGTAKAAAGEPGPFFLAVIARRIWRAIRRR